MTPPRIELVGPSRDQARLASYLYLGACPGLAHWQDRSGSRWWVRHSRRRTRAALLIIEERIQPGPRPRADEVVVFAIDRSRHQELGRWRAAPAGWEALHDIPLALPVAPRRGVVHPLGSGSLELRHAGPIRWADGGHSQQLEAILLIGQEQGRPQPRQQCQPSPQWQTRQQWQGRGIGPIAIGPLGGPPKRWLCHFRGEGLTLGRAEPAPSLPDPIDPIPLLRSLSR